MTQAVVFDYGLTLVTFSYPEAELVAAMEAARAWLPPGAPTGAEIVNRVLLPLERLRESTEEREVDYLSVYRGAWAAYGCQLDEELAWRTIDAEQRVWEAAARLAPGATGVLAELRARGLRTGLASNALYPEPLLLRQLEAVGLRGLLDCPVFSSAVGWRKPNPALYRAVLDCLGVEAGEVLFVGDRPDLDYETPRRLGMRALLYTGLSGEQPPPGVPAVTDLREVLDHV